jgi:GGDEF domain-containing protein
MPLVGEQLPQEIERAHRYGRALSIVMADLDGFKPINDLHGHSIGDEVLKCFSDRVGGSIRAYSDWMARYGGGRENASAVRCHTHGHLDRWIPCHAELRRGQRIDAARGSQRRGGTTAVRRRGPVPQ